MTDVAMHVHESSRGTAPPDAQDGAPQPVPGAPLRPAPVSHVVAPDLVRRGGVAADPLGGTEVATPLRRVLDARRSRGERLPAELGESLGAAMGTSFERVRVHADPAAAGIADQLQARAFTYGTDVYFAQGTYAPGTTGGRSLLAHELAHVVQEGSGSSGTGRAPLVGRADDPAEAAADALAHRALVGHLPSDRPSDATPGAPHAVAAGAEEVRRVVVVNGARCTDAEATYQAMYQAVTGTTYPKTGRVLSNEIAIVKDKVVALLASWIAVENTAGIGPQVKRAVLGQVPVGRVYSNYVDLAVALVGEIEAAPQLKAETDLAARAMDSAYLSHQLDTLMPKLKTQFQTRMGTTIAARYGNWHMGKYYPWYLIGFTGGFGDVFDNPSTYSLAAKVAAIHDLTDCYFEIQPAAVQVPPSKSKGTSLVGGPHKADLVDGTGKATFRDKATGTLDEQNEVIVSARWLKKPIQMGPSFTTGRFMELAHGAGADVETLEALAWALFAFWNQKYTTSASGVHRFHFVMDMANNYGVPYSMTADLPADPPTFKREEVVIDLGV